MTDPVPAKPIPDGYRPQLDGLRALAALNILFIHFVPLRFHEPVPSGPVSIVVFFVLSGFLITRILLRVRQAQDRSWATRAFYVRRILRIFPLYWMVVAGLWWAGVTPVREGLAWLLGCVVNVWFVVQQDWAAPIGHLWTVAVEQQFYLLWPVVLLAVKDRHVPWAIGGLVTVGVVSRLVRTVWFPADPWSLVLLPLNATSLGAGAWLAWREHGRRGLSPSTLRGMGAAMGVWALAVVAPWAGWASRWWLDVQHLSAVVAMTALVWAAAVGLRGPAGALLGWGPVVYVGRITYGVYVYHNLVRLLVLPALQGVGIDPHQGGWALLVYALGQLVTTLAIAGLSFHLVEQPFDRLKRLVPYRRASQG